MATQIHATVAMWATELIAQGGALGVWNPKDLQFGTKWRLQGFVAQYQGM